MTTILSKIVGSIHIEIQNPREEWGFERPSRLVYPVTFTSASGHDAHEDFLRTAYVQEPERVLESVLAFLDAAADAHSYGPESENWDLFPGWLREATYESSGEIDLLARELCAGDDD